MAIYFMLFYASNTHKALRKKYPYSEFFSVFRAGNYGPEKFRKRTFLRSEVIILKLPWEPKITTQTILHKYLTRKGESNIFAKFWKILTSIMEGK